MSTITIFHFRGRDAFWMLSKMRLGWTADFREIPGLRFFKLMGSGGKAGFSIFPDFKTYAFLGVWESEEDAQAFFKGNLHFQAFYSRSESFFTVYLEAVKAHGLWSGVQPFDFEAKYESGPIAVLTRAAIKPWLIPAFFRRVPAASAALQEQEGLLYSIGVGELPLIRQATFSIWESREAMYEYAYRHTSHVDVIRKTRELGWYSEELFANFVPYRIEGDEELVGRLEGLIGR